MPEAVSTVSHSALAERGTGQNNDARKASSAPQGTEKLHREVPCRRRYLDNGRASSGGDSVNFANEDRNGGCSFESECREDRGASARALTIQGRQNIGTAGNPKGPFRVSCIDGGFGFFRPCSNTDWSGFPAEERGEAARLRVRAGQASQHEPQAVGP